MLALLFEVMPKPGHAEHYFRHVEMLKPVLAEHTGMLWLDRFTSLTRDDVILSHQLWEDDAAIARWREDEQHKGSQAAGRNKHFQDYRIRIAELLLKVDKDKPAQEFSVGPEATGSFIVVGHSQGRPLQGFEETFASVNTQGAFAGVSAASDESHARNLLLSVADDPAMSWAFAGRVIRDYGMYERDQAPQHYPPAGFSGED